MMCQGVTHSSPKVNNAAFFPHIRRVQSHATGRAIKLIVSIGNLIDNLDGPRKRTNKEAKYANSALCCPCPHPQSMTG